MRPNLTAEQRQAQADEWRALRRDNPAGTRRLWRMDRDWLKKLRSERGPAEKVRWSRSHESLPF
jgi:hypothetical protein